LTMDGDVAADAPIPLQSGWCLVGYNCLVAKEPEEALLSIAGNYDSVWAYNTSEHDWERHLSDWPEFLSDLDVMTPGMGYWINAAVDCLWDVSATALPGAPATVSRKSHDSTNRPELPYTLWGSVEADGVKMTKKDECTVVLKVGDVARISYQLGSVKQYGDYYALDLPGSLAGLAQAELYVQFRDTIIKAVSAPTGRPGRVIRVDLSVQAAPKTSSLHQNFPNPFNPDTWIPYQLMEDAFVVIRIHSVTGQLIRTLELGHKRAGFYTNRDKAAFWDGRDEEGESVGSGIYFIHFEGGSFSAMRKMVMIR